MAMICGTSSDRIFRVFNSLAIPSSVDPKDLHVLCDPFGGQVNPSVISALLHFLFDHLLSVDLKLGLIGWIERLPYGRNGLGYAHPFSAGSIHRCI